MNNDMEVIDLTSNDYNNKIIHYTKADFCRQVAGNVVCLKQYDNELPLIAIKLFANGYTYSVPAGATAKIRWKKPDGTYVYREAAGTNQERNIVYFVVDQNMSANYGSLNPILEIITGVKTVQIPDPEHPGATKNENIDILANSSYIHIEIGKNPIQNEDQESKVDDTLINQLKNLVNTVDFEIDTGNHTPSSKLRVGGIYYEKLLDESE